MLGFLLGLTHASASIVLSFEGCHNDIDFWLIIIRDFSAPSIE